MNQQQSVGSPPPEVPRLWDEGVLFTALPLWSSVPCLSPLWRADHWDKNTAVDRAGVGGGPTPPSFNPGVEFGGGTGPWVSVLPRACCEAFWESGGSRGPVLVDAGGRQVAGQLLTDRQVGGETAPIWGEPEF